MFCINAGNEINISKFPNIRRFVFTDTLPRAPESKDFRHKFLPQNYDKFFINKLYDNFAKQGFICTNAEIIDKDYYKSVVNICQRIKFAITQVPNYFNPTKLTFFNGITTIEYYVSTNLKYSRLDDNLINAITNLQSLLVINEFPTKEILKLFKYPKKLIITDKVIDNLLKNSIPEPNLIDDYLWCHQYFNEFININNQYNIYYSYTDLLESFGIFEV